MTDKTQKVESKATNTAGETKVRKQRKPKPITLAKYKFDEVYRAAERRVGRETDDSDMKLDAARALLILRDKVSEVTQPGPQQSEAVAEKELPSNKAQMDIVVEQMFKFGSAPATNAVPDVSVAVASFTAMQYARRCLRQGELGGLHKKSIQEKTTELLAARKSQMDYRKANGYGNKVTPSPDVAKTLVELNNKVNKLELERADLVAKYREATKNFDFCALAAREKFLDTLF